MIPVFRPSVAQSAAARLGDSLSSGWWSYGERCHELEALFEKSWGGKCLVVSSCTSALYVVARVLRAHGSRGAVVVPAMTFSSTAAAFAHADFEIRLADVDAETLLLSPESVVLRAGTSASAVVCVDLYGQRCQISAVADAARRSGAVIIEDRAHRIGLDTLPEGDFVCASFNTVKELPGGEGGLLWCRDPHDASYARAMSNMGMDTDPWTRSRTAVHADYRFRPDFGLKLRLNDLAASLVLAAVEEHPEQRARRRALHERYVGVSAKMGSLLRMIPRREDDSFLMQVARVPAGCRDRLRESLAQASVATSVHYPSLTNHPRLREQRCPVAELASTELVTLPSSTTMSDQDWSDVATALRRGGEGV